MQRAEQEGLPYVFKLRLTTGTRRLVERLMRARDWVEAGQGKVPRQNFGSVAGVAPAGSWCYAVG
jgi:hypothetical protein